MKEVWVSLKEITWEFIILKQLHEINKQLNIWILCLFCMWKCLFMMESHSQKKPLLNIMIIMRN